MKITQPDGLSGVPEFLTCTSCRASKHIRAFGWTKKHRFFNCQSCQRKAADKSIRDRVLTAYGSKCACCGERHREFLAIDHIGNWGHLDKAKRTSSVYYRLVREGFPTDRYRLLCHNCNSSIGHYGYCPHRPEDVCGKAQDLAREHRKRIAIIKRAVEARKLAALGAK